MNKVLQTNNVVSHSVSQYLLLSLFYFISSFQYSLNDWCFLIFLFVPSLQSNAQKKSAAIEWVNFIWGHVCITAVKTSNINKISVNTVLMRQLQTTLNLITNNNALSRSNFKVLLYWFSLQKFSNSQFTTLKCFSQVYLSSRISNKP